MEKHNEVKRKGIWDFLIRDIKRDFKRGKNLECLLDFVFFQFYLEGQFGNMLPVQEGREVMKLLIGLLTPEAKIKK